MTAEAFPARPTTARGARRRRTLVTRAGAALFLAMLAGIVLLPLLARLGAGTASAQGRERWVWTRISEIRPKGLAFSPGFGENHTAYLGSSNLDHPPVGFAFSTDQGRTWTPSNQGLPVEKELMVNCLVAMPVAGQPDLLLMAGERRFHAATEPSGALFRSTDGGRTWSEVQMAGMPRLGEQTFQVIEHLAVSPDFARDQWLVAAVRGRGIYVSADGGANWQQGVGGRGAALVISPAFAQDRTVFAAVAGKGLLRSTDGGYTWAPASQDLGSVLLSLAISPNFAEDGTLFVGTPVAGVLRSTDGGSTWAECNGSLGSQEVCALAVSPDYADDHTLVAGSSRGAVYISTDAGAGWEDTGAAALREPVLTLRFSPDYAARPRIWAVGTFGGTWEYSPAESKASAEATATAVEVSRLATLAAKPTARPTGTPQIELQRDRQETGCISYTLAVPLLGVVLCLRSRYHPNP